MYDRSVQFSQRYRLKKVEGTDDIFDLIPAPGTVNNEGTLINKAALLKDMTAALFGLTTDAVPDDVLKILAQAALYKTVTPTAQLGTLPEGSIIYLNENGSPVPFYVAKQGYEPDYNTDRVLVVRKDAVQLGARNSSGVNTYNGSTIDTWMNGTYLQALDSDVQTTIGTTNIPATSPYNSGVIRLNKAVFSLSLTELGKSSANANVEGTASPVANILQVAKIGVTSYSQWTRTPQTNSASEAWRLGTSGVELSQECITQLAYRPAFTLPLTFTAYIEDPIFGLYDVSDNLLLKLPGVQIETGSYVGTGTYGSSNPNSLTFGFEPKVVFIHANGSSSYCQFYCFALTDVYSSFGYMGSVDGTMQTTDPYRAKVSNNLLNWYYDGGASQALRQFNSTGFTYTYIVIG